MNLRRTLLIAALLACIAESTAGAPVGADELCASGYVGSQQLPGCSDGPPGVFVGPCGIEPLVSVFVCANAR